MTKFILLSLFVVVSTSASAAEKLPTFRTIPGCEAAVEKAFVKTGFGAREEELESDSIGTLCEGNNSLNAIACIRGVSAQKPKMRPLGLATVCSGGVSSRDAVTCLDRVAPETDTWVTAVDACSGIARQVSVCLASSRSPTCLDVQGAGKSGAGAASSNR